MSDATTGYRLPPREIVELVDAPETPDAILSPDRHQLLLLQRPGLPSINELARPELRLGGLRIDPATNGPSRVNAYASLTLALLAGGVARDIGGLPAEARLDAVTWSPDGRHLAFTVRQETGLALWTASAAGGRARPLTPPRLNAATGTPYHWLPDSSGLVARLVPEGRSAPPAAPAIPSGPVIQGNSGRVAPARTYQDLLNA